MITFLAPEALRFGAVVVVPLLAFVVAFRKGRRAQRKLKMQPASKWLAAMDVVSCALLFGLLVAALARPVIRHETYQRSRTDVEVIFAFDISRSMMASATADGTMRFDRARRFAMELRRAIPGIPVGIASFTDRAVPHLFPSPPVSFGNFQAVLMDALAIERPRPDRKHEDAPATLLSALQSVARHHYFSPAAKTRIIVVFTDGEVGDTSFSALRKALAEEKVSMVFVQFWGSQERVFGIDGKPERYRPRPDAPAFLDDIAQQLGTPAFREGQFDETVQALRAKLGEGPVVKRVRETTTEDLAIYFVLASLLIPLPIILYRLNS